MGTGTLSQVIDSEDVEIIRSLNMVCARVAIQQGAKIFVSPAMWSLISGAEADELRFFVSHIRVVKIPSPPRLPALFPLFHAFK